MESGLARQNPKVLYDPAMKKTVVALALLPILKVRKVTISWPKAWSLLTNLTHRGATGYDPKLGDGAGLLMQMPDAFMRKEAGKLNIQLPEVGQYAVGHLFLPQDAQTVPNVKPSSPKLLQKKIKRS